MTVRTFRRCQISPARRVLFRDSSSRLHRVPLDFDVAVFQLGPQPACHLAQFLNLRSESFRADRLLSVRPWRPVPAQYKLSSGLSLTADCGLIARKELDKPITG